MGSPEYGVTNLVTDSGLSGLELVQLGAITLAQVFRDHMKPLQCTGCAKDGKTPDLIKLCHLQMSVKREFYTSGSKVSLSGMQNPTAIRSTGFSPPCCVWSIFVCLNSHIVLFDCLSVHCYSSHYCTSAKVFMSSKAAVGKRAGSQEQCNNA